MIANALLDVGNVIAAIILVTNTRISMKTKLLIIVLFTMRLTYHYRTQIMPGDSTNMSM